MIAVNANTGDFAWEVPLGITESLPEGKQNTGVSFLAGPMATRWRLWSSSAQPMTIASARSIHEPARSCG